MQMTYKGSQPETLVKCVDYTNMSLSWILHTRSPDFGLG